jgi:GT2 family glycosyltransferase
MSTSDTRPLSVIVVTYEWPRALDVVLRALSEQSDTRFDVVVADDGSTSETASVVERWRSAFGERRLTHAWQVDKGYRRARVLNVAASIATGDGFVFIDGDSVPRLDFVRSIRKALLPGWFLAGKRVNLSQGLTARVLEEELPVWRWSVPTWFARAPREVRRPGLIVSLRDRRRPWRPRQPEFEPPYNAYGCMLAVSRADFERVNGFDATFVGWGQEDEEIAVRLGRAGLRCGWAGPRSTLIHLWHHSRKGDARPNSSLLRVTRESDRVEAVQGLRELGHELEPEASQAVSS